MNNQNDDSKKNPADPRKEPAPGYPEKKLPKKDIQEHPEDQNTG